MNALVELEQARKSYGATTVLREVDLRLKAGQRLAIVGPSGSGKSTLLNLLGLLDHLEGGVYRFDGRNVSGLNEREKAAVRSKEIGFVFQLHHLLPQITVLENALLPAYALPEKPDWAVVEERARTLLERVGMSAHLGKLPGQLSGGERQRVAVVRALVNRPRLLLADEPTGALDRVNAHALAALLFEISADSEACLVLVTHDPEIAEKAGETWRLDEGRLARQS
ncbi:MAG TPA: ABC transporter ATP-binding protein [Verrucomicrobiales bacterium]|nr:ABC transporter ATP-binding protein [Verrucomicrobiales bacterium]